MSASLPDNTVAKVLLRLVSFTNLSFSSHVMKLGQAAKACNIALRKQVFPKFTRPANLPLPPPELGVGPQNINAPTTAAAVKPAATRILSDSIFIYIIVCILLI